MSETPGASCGVTRPVVVLTRRWPEAVEASLAAAFDLRPNEDDHPFSQAELVAALAEADGVGATVTDRFDAEVFAARPRARILANFGVGVNHIDLSAARAAGVAVTNTPDVLTDCTADLAMTLLLMSARRAGEGERELRSGRWRGWRPTHLRGLRVSGATLGIVGMGRIGRALAHRAHDGFGMRVLCYNRRPLPESVLGEVAARQVESLDALLPQVDFLSLHCPATPETEHLINAGRLALMRPSAHLINTSRGAVVDEAALAEALANKALAGAGLDVYAAEPQVPEALLRLPNVVLLPHLGSATEATREAMGMRALVNLRTCFEGRTPPDRLD